VEREESEDSLLLAASAAQTSSDIERVYTFLIVLAINILYYNSKFTYSVLVLVT